MSQAGACFGVEHILEHSVELSVGVLRGLATEDEVRGKAEKSIAISTSSSDYYESLDLRPHCEEKGVKIGQYGDFGNLCGNYALYVQYRIIQYRKYTMV